MTKANSTRAAGTKADENPDATPAVVTPSVATPEPTPEAKPVAASIARTDDQPAPRPAASFEPRPAPLTPAVVVPNAEQADGLSAVVRACPAGGLVVVQSDALADDARRLAGQLGKSVSVKVKPHLPVAALWRHAKGR